MNMDRLQFIKKSLAFTVSGWAGLSGFASRPTVGNESAGAGTISLLYTNDTHSRIDPFSDHAVEHAGLGGMTRRATLVNRIRSSEKHTLLLDAGDVFHGTPWFHLFGGRRSFELMSKMGYDAMCLGEHEFINGLEGFAEVAPAAEFPFLCANYYVSNTPMTPFVEKYAVRDFDGFRIGIFGLGINPEGLVKKELYGSVRYRDPVVWARGMVSSLTTYHDCDYIICLSHLGYRYEDQRIDDRKLASQVDGINLIIGGHSHTFLDRPERIISPNGSPTLVTQAGHSGIRLGRIDLSLNDSGEVGEMISYQYTIGPEETEDSEIHRNRLMNPAG
ncbi:MAG: metallophosphatase [Balneolaceae bacterium]